MMPSPPICIRQKITSWPKGVKSVSGTVNNPVTQVTDVEVKRRSIREIGTFRAIGNDKRNVPIAIAQPTEARIMRPGEKCEICFTGMYAFLMIALETK